MRLKPCGFSARCGILYKMEGRKHFEQPNYVVSQIEMYSTLENMS